MQIPIQCTCKNVYHTKVLSLSASVKLLFCLCKIKIPYDKLLRNTCVTFTTSQKIPATQQMFPVAYLLVKTSSSHKDVAFYMQPLC